MSLIKSPKPSVWILDFQCDAGESFGVQEVYDSLVEKEVNVVTYRTPAAFANAVENLKHGDGKRASQNVNLVVVFVIDSFVQIESQHDLLIKVQALIASQNSFIPWVVISPTQNMAEQLSAYQKGITHYWSQKDKSNEDIRQHLIELVESSTKPSYRVIVVDDSPIVLEIQSNILKAEGMKVWSIQDPMQLPEVLHKANPDVIVLDLHMPQACGAQVAWVIRQLKTDAELPIIFVSGEDDLEHQILALKHGGDDFILKPVNPKQFSETVKMRAERAREHNRIQYLLKQKLYEQAREYQALNQHAIVSIADRAGRITEVNNKFCEISGYSRQELIGQNHRLVKSQRHSPAFYEHLWATISSGQVWQGEICNRSKQGAEYWVQSTIAPFMDEQGEIYQYVSIRTDITQIKNLEIEQKRRLFEQGERVKEWRCLSRIMDLLSDDILDDDFLLQKVVNSIPPGWREPKDTCAKIEFRGQSFSTTNFTETQWCQTSFTDDDQFGIKLTVCRLYPKSSEMDDGYGVLLDEEQRLLDNIALQIMQTFKRREAQRAIKQAMEQAEKANRAKSDFLSAMSHELRTPLNSIIGFSQLLELSDVSEKQKKQLHTIATSGKHLLSLINDVLEFAKLESGKIQLNIEPLDVRPIIDQVVALIESHAYAQKVEIKVAPWTCTYLIKADPIRFKQVILNLMSNGVKYNRPNGSIELRWRIEEVKGADYWVFEVQDSGVGIAEEDFGRLFEPFDRLGHESSSIEGTGIGLSITKDLVEQMGGRIEVESKLGIGTTFKVYLPLAIEQPVSLHGVSAPVSSGKEAERKHSESKSETPPLKVLYVEDNLSNIKLMAEVVQLIEGVELRIAPSAENGLQQAKDWLPHLILLDINLPGMNGDESIGHFKALPNYENTGYPVIYAVTANVLDGQIQKYQSLGFDEVIAKPFELAEIIERVKSVKKTFI